MGETPLTRSPWQNPVLGWIAACVAATAVACCFFWGILENPDMVLMLFGFVLAFSSIPSLITVLICERYSIRNFILYVLAGIASAVGVASFTFGVDDLFAGVLFASVGSSMGMTYWSISGRYSGLRFHRENATT
jgi:hypothetical protein